MPMGMAWTIPGAVLLAPPLARGVPFGEIIGAHYVTAALILIVGRTGWVRRIMDGLPLPIVMGMVAGVFLPIVLKVVTAFEQAAAIAGATLAAFIAISLMPSVARKISPVLGALIVGAAATVASGEFALEAPLIWSFADPILYRPSFSLGT